MAYKHVVVWLDHSEAHVIHFNAEAAESEQVKIHSTHPHLHKKSGIPGVGRAPEDTHYFEAVAKAINDSTEVLIVGPGFEKLALMKHFVKHHPKLADAVVSVETVDHPSDGQLLKFARKYFLKADLYI